MRWIGFAALFLAAASFGTASGVLFAYMGDLPQISALDDQAPVTGTRVLGKDGSVVYEFATEHRQPIAYDQIPQVLQQAIVATEDAGFWHNSGVDLKRIAVIVIRRALFQRTGGASTITQQLARSVFPKTIGYERSGLAGIERKAKEWLFAIQIDKRYTKQEILTMYCNKMYFGGGAYGVEAASQYYFGKSVTALKLDEAALIAGLFQGNESQNPYKHMPEALARRNTVLGRMAAEGYITPDAAASAKKRPIVTVGLPATRTIAPYFVEEIRIELEKRYGTKAVWEGGLTVKTGLDPALQQTANRALDAQLRYMDKTFRGGYRKPARNLLAEGKTIEGYKNPRWQHDPLEGEILPAVVTSVTAGVISATAGQWDATIGPDGYKWTGRRAETLVRRGDLIEVQVGKLAPKSKSFMARLDQASEFEGAVLAIDNHTGQVLAMVGGKDFQRRQFNNSTQAMRQVGSLFKAFVYTTAIDRGYTASTYLPDVPSSFVAGTNQPLYEPKNFDNKFEGDVTVRHALEDSRNVPTIRLMDLLGPPAVIETARKFGVTGPLPPVLAVAIGAGDDTLWEMTSAYTTFPNQGVRMAPLAILEVTDREGNVLESHRPDPHEVIKADTAFIMTSLFQGVIERGTARQASIDIHDWPIAGKTGTTDDATDAWFIGFDPDITIGVWVGYDQKKTMGKEVQGAMVALPVWINIMKPWIERRRAELGAPPVFAQPGNIVFQMTDKGILEAYIAGTEPGGRSQASTPSRTSTIGNR